MNKDNTLKITNLTKSKIINADAKNNEKVNAYKKAMIDKATKEIEKIEEDIKNLEQK